MNRRTKILAAVFGVIVGLGMLKQAVWPRWIAPLLTLDDRIAEQQAHLDKLLAEQDTVRRGVEEYRSMVDRVGSFDIGQVQTQVLDRLGSLIEKHKLEDVNVTPGRPRTDSKTGLRRMLITVKAFSTLQSAVAFLADVAELPQLVRIGNAAISPASRSRKAKGKQRMNLRVPIEVLVVPQQRVVGLIDEANLEQPRTFARHQDRNYSAIWDLKPFSEYIPPKPLRANAGRDIRATPGKKAVRLDGKASGGVGALTLRWEPTDYLNDPNIARPTVDTTDPFQQTYTLTATDETGKVSTDTVKLVVKDPPPKPVPVAKPEPRSVVPVKPRITRWKDNEYMRLRMTLLSSTEAKRTDELAVYNNRVKRMNYYAVGDEFDGGRLVYVHPTGALVHRNDQYFIYPIGAFLDEDLPEGEIDETFSFDFPQLSSAIAWFNREDATDTQVDEEAASKPESESDEAAEPAALPKEDTMKPATSDAKKASRLKGTRKRNVTRTAGKKKPREETPPGYPQLPDEIMKRLIEEQAQRAAEQEAEKSSDE